MFELEHRIADGPPPSCIIKDDPEALAMFREAMKGEEGGDKRSKGDTTCNNVTGADAVTGNSKAYTLSRLQRSEY